ncbi:hypothetical protein C8R44DRAFT_160883 [Mycena epipterygia]|nr:hypothetical protein C8R44DRAFT_160883 [Mycena epipterygia]
MGPLTAAFVPHGGARTFAALALAVSRVQFSDVKIGMHFVFEKCLMIMSQTFASPSGYKQLPQALEGGLLAALVSAAKSPWADKVYRESLKLLAFIVQPYTVYHSVLSKMNVALLDAAADERDGRFKSSKLCFEWTTLGESTKERLEALDYFRTRDAEYKACDNDECGRIDEKADFKRCTGCLSSYYCSTACQARDWHDGGHSQHCTPNPVFGLNERTAFGTRDRSFLRALIHYDYCQHAVYRIYMAELKLIHSHHPDTPLFVLFDYTLGYLEITVQAVTEATELSGSPYWLHWVARAEKSRGRIRLHVMRVWEEARQTYWVIPLRTDTSRVYHGLQQIAAELPGEQAGWNMDAILRRIQALVPNDEEGGVEIH